MRLAYADPPYPGQSTKHYADHPDYAGEVDHLALLRSLTSEYDGWVLHTASTTLPIVLGLAAQLGINDFRLMAWVKPFAAFKRNVSVAYAWEPVLVKPVRKPVVSGRMVMRGTYVRVAWPDGFVREVCDTCWARDTEGMDERLDMEEGDDGD